MLLLIYALGICSTVIASSAEIIDFGEDCANNLKTSFFLTRGMGSVDAVSLLFNTYHKNCTIGFYNSKGNVQIFVVKLLQDNNKERFCEKNNFIQILGDDKRINICEKFSPYNVYMGIWNTTKTTVKIRCNSFHGFKLIVTSGRVLEYKEQCDFERDIMCPLKIEDINKSACIDSELVCDKNINCGIEDGADEDYRLCHADHYQKRWLLITGAILLITILVSLLVYFCWKCLPAIPIHYFKNTLLEDKLIVVTQVSPRSTKKICKKTVEIEGAANLSVSINHRNKGNISGRNEKQQYVGGGSYLSPVVVKKRGKRLATNSPVYRHPPAHHVSRMLSMSRTLSNIDETLTHSSSSQKEHNVPTSPPATHRFIYDMS